MLVRMPSRCARRWIDEVAIGAALVVADLLPHALGEDLGAAAGQRIEPRLLQLAQHLLVGLAVEIGEERDLDGGEALQVDLGADLLEAAQHVRVVRERQVGMQAVDDVDFGQRLAGALPQLVPRLLERHRVRPGIAGTQPRERAEQAARDADVGRLEPDVEVVVGARAVALLALAVGEPAERERVGTVEQARRRPRTTGGRRRRASRRCHRARGAARRLPSIQPSLCILRLAVLEVRLTARRSREVGAKPTRCRHCKRGATSSTGLPLCRRSERKVRDGEWEGGDDATIREPGYLAARAR